MVAVTLEAFTILEDRLVRQFGNRLSEAHREGLMATVGGFACLAFGRRSGRYAYPLPTGCGKTQAVVAFTAALHRQGERTRHPWLGKSILIAASSVEALATIKRDMLTLGIPESDVGLLHAKRHDPEKALTDPAAFASEPSTDDNDKRPVLLVTHSRLQHARSDARRLDAVATFNGQRRSVVIWDEVLVATEAWATTTLSLASAIGAIAPYVEAGAAKPAMVTALRYLREVEVAVDAERDRQDQGESPALVTLPALHEVEEDAAAAALKKWAPDAVPLVRMSGRQVRVAPMSAKGVGKAAVVDFVVSVPDDIKDMAILDASHVVSRLVARDASIRVAPELQGREVKRYDNVTVYHWKTPSGRQAVESAFSGPGYDRDPLCLEAVGTIQHLPPDEPAIVFTFKKRGGGPDIAQRLATRLRAAGVDPDALTSEGHKRVTFVRWGSHTSANTWAYARHIVPVGVLHRGDVDLLASMISQSRDLLSDKDGFPTLKEIQRGEVASALYQAMSRGCCRYTDNGQARAMTVWLPHSDGKVREELEKLMPGLQWKPWPLRHCQASVGRISDAVLRISEALRSQPSTVLRISTRELKKACGLGDIPKRTFSAAASRLSGTMGWLLEGQSFARINEGGFTFDDDGPQP